MRQHNAENERVKREYLIYLKAAKGLSEASLDTVARAFHRFEVSTTAAEAGLSWITVRRAQKALGIKPRKTDIAGGWQWELPNKPQDQVSEDALPGA